MKKESNERFETSRLNYSRLRWMLIQHFPRVCETADAGTRWLTGIRASQYPKFGDASRPIVVCRSNLINNVNQATSLSPGRRKDAIRLAGNISIVFSSVEMRWREFWITKEKITRVLFYRCSLHDVNRIDVIYLEIILNSWTVLQFVFCKQTLR